MGYETKPLKMKKFILPAILCFFGISAFAQIENGDFENWSKLILFEHPVTGMSTMSSNYETFFDNGETNVNQIFHEEGKALRVENIQGSEEVMPGYFLFGNTPNSDGEEMIFGEGFDVSDASVTGVRMDLNYNFPNESNGFIIVQFKSEGVPVGEGNMGSGTHMFPISGTQDWATTEFNFEAPVEAAIDQCVIGIASGDLIMEDSPFELGSFVEVDNVELMNSSDVVPGGDFDTWVAVDPIYYPENIHVDIRPFDATFQRTEEAFEGNLALELLSIDYNGQVEIGEAVFGLVENEDITPNIELPEGSSMVNFMYKYSSGLDKGEVRFIFYQEDGESFNPVYTEALELSLTDGFEMVEYDFGTIFNENDIEASHMAIVFSSSKMEDNQPQAGSVLTVDNVQFGSALGLFDRFDRISTLTITAYPNPTIGRVVFDFHGSNSGYYRVFNGSGMQIDIVEYSNAEKVIYNLLSHAPGKYFFTFNHNSGHTESVRVMKQ